MKPINVQDISKYPINYNNIQEEDKVKILSYMNGMQALCERYYTKYFEDSDNKSLRLYQHTLTGLTGAKNAYATLGIMVEKWGSNGEWILATKIDAEDYNNTEEETSEIIEEINELISYGDIQ